MSCGKLVGSQSFQPHMHLRGKAMSIEAILPNGTIQMLSLVDHFDFNWMTQVISTPTMLRRCCRRVRS